MKRYFIILLTAVVFLAGYCLADQGKPDPSQLFYNGNSFYEKRDYDKAVEDYTKILDMGIESPSLYYNIGNSYFKLGKIGYAILYYERAKRLMPQDADMESNLAYAKSLVGNPSFQMPEPKIAVSLIKKPFEDFNLNAIAISAFALYIVVVLMLSVFMINSYIAKKMRIIFAVVVVMFLASLSAFAIRFYDEELLARGVVVQKNVECKYEPIDKSITFYKLQEGDQVVVLKTRSGWTQIERPDGKIGWVAKDAVEEI